MKLSTEILVLGGGATGLGAAWDAALRGFKTLLAEIFVGEDGFLRNPFS